MPTPSRKAFRFRVRGNADAEVSAMLRRAKCAVPAGGRPGRQTIAPAGSNGAVVEGGNEAAEASVKQVLLGPGEYAGHQ